MIAFEITLNGKKLSVCGREDLCVLSMFLDAGACCGSKANLTGISFKKCDLHLSVGGAVSGDDGKNVEWLEFVPLKVNDLLAVRIIETKKASPTVKTNDPTLPSTKHFVPKKALVFQISKNKVQLFNAGRDGLNTMGVILSAHGQLGKKSRGTLPQQTGQSRDGFCIAFDVRGSYRTKKGSLELLNWANEERLEVDDVVEVKILDTKEVSRPLSRT